MYSHIINKIDWQKCSNMIPVIVQDVITFDVLMLGFMTDEALQLTIKTGKVHFFSRTKNRIWMKGEESGNILKVSDIKIDCDNDSLLVLVNPIGNTCHSGTKSCFDYRVNFLSVLKETINDRMATSKETSYISTLYGKGINKVAQKVGEEATEVVIAALNESDVHFLNESADLLFHLMLLIMSKNLTLDNVIAILNERHNSA